MPREFMLYIRNAGDAKASLSVEEHLNFIKQCEVYIGLFIPNKAANHRLPQHPYAGLVKFQLI